ASPGLPSRGTEMKNDAIIFKEFVKQAARRRISFREDTFGVTLTAGTYVPSDTRKTLAELVHEDRAEMDYLGFSRQLLGPLTVTPAVFNGKSYASDFSITLPNVFFPAVVQRAGGALVYHVDTDLLVSWHKIEDNEDEVLDLTIKWAKPTL